MTDEKRVLLKAIGWLLEYPDEHFPEQLHALETILEDLPPSAPRTELLEAIGGLDRIDSTSLREEYTRLFDFSPGTSLDLTYHKWGDARERGPALAWLRRMYEDAGWQPANGELPDFLPLLLEFLALAPESLCRRVLDEYRVELRGLADRVAAASSAYGAILKVLPRVALE